MTTKENFPIKTARNLAETQLTTRNACQANNTPLINEQLQTISLDDLKKSNFTYCGAVPFLSNGLSALCTQNPLDKDGKPLIKGQGEDCTHYSALIPWDYFLDLCTDNVAMVRKDFECELVKAFRQSPEVLVSLGNGYSMLTKPFIIRSIIFNDLSQMTPKEAKQCQKIGISKVIAAIDIEFFKPLFCLGPETRQGFISMDKAAYTKMLLTMDKINATPAYLAEFAQLYNPFTGERPKKAPQTYYKFLLYFLQHLTSNQAASFITIDAVEMLRQVDPGQIGSDGKIKNKYDTKLFIDSAGKLFNFMARFGYCEYTDAAIAYCLYHRDDNNFEIHFKRERPRLSINPFTSNFEQDQASLNPPQEVKHF